LPPLTVHAPRSRGPELRTQLAEAFQALFRRGHRPLAIGSDQTDPGPAIEDVVDVQRALMGSRLIRLFPTVFKGTHVDLDEVTTARAKSVDIECPGINAYADGEYACQLPAEISAVPDALHVLRPPQLAVGT
jgi:hypothetical protein